MLFEKSKTFLKIEDNVIFLGNTKDIESEYRKASIFVNSARYESFGLVTAEAMSFSLPCIGFADCPGTNDLIKHGYSGYLVPPLKDRVNALSCVLIDVINKEIKKFLSSIDNNKNIKPVLDKYTTSISDDLDKGHITTNVCMVAASVLKANPIGNNCEIPPGYEEYQIDMNRGDIIIFHGHLIHKAPKNRSKTSEYRHVNYLKLIKNGKGFWPGWSERRVLVERLDFNEKFKIV